MTTIKLTYKNGNILVQNVEWFRITEECLEYKNFKRVHPITADHVKISWSNIESITTEE